MKIDSIDVDEAIKEAEDLLDRDTSLSSSAKTTFRVLLLLVKLLVHQLSLNSRNSSKPPSSDGLKKVSKKKKASDKSQGGQKGHLGVTLRPVATPDRIQVIKMDKRRLPKGSYTESGFEKRQVIDIEIKRIITEYQAQILMDKKGQRFVAPFPEGITRPIQYGASVKAHAVYLSQWQLLPFNRIQEQFTDSYHLSISMGSLYQFNQEACERLAAFEKAAKHNLSRSVVAHADETGINVNGKGHWLHCVSNATWSLFAPHAKRGHEAMDAMDILPHFKGVLCHDHWRSYYRYDCTHSLCNAHHLRELTRAHEQDDQQWAKAMHDLLLDINKAVQSANGVLPLSSQLTWTRKYRSLLKKANRECPAPEPPKEKKRGRIKRSKARNLLERLRDHESEVLLFMRKKEVPFTNNQGERDIRMTKVQQKISGCFRSTEGAMAFCRIRSYLSTCRKHDMGAAEALEILFSGKLPDFIQSELDKISEKC